MAINTKFAGKQAFCRICNKVIKAQNDKAFHLQKHFSIAITSDDMKFLEDVKVGVSA